MSAREDELFRKICPAASVSKRERVVAKVLMHHACSYAVIIFARGVYLR